MVAIGRMRSVAGLAVWAMALVMVAGCATKGFVRSEVAGSKAYTDTQIGGVRGDLDQVRTQATLAERLASGNIDYAEVSSQQVQFDFDDYRLKAEAQSMLDQMAAQLASHPGYVLEVRGFADATGPERYNYRLGRERADAVLRYMMKRHSVPTARLVPVSFGEDDPVADNSSSEGRAQNRRVQVRVLEIKPGGQPSAVIP